MADVKIDNVKQYTTIAACFDGHDDAPVQCCVHCPMEGLQCFTRSHWTLLLGEYLLRIIPADNGVACKKKTTKKHHTCWPFWWPWWSAGTIPRTSPNRGGPELRRKPLVDATGQVLRAIVGNETKKHCFFSKFSHCRPTEKGLEVSRWQQWGYDISIWREGVK